MRAQHRIVTWITASYFATLGLLPASLNAGDFIKSVFKGPEVTTKEPCVERLAQEIDWLERHIEQYGSVVAKQPDVWGQARLTKHRDELEKKLFEQLNQFQVYLNGTLNRADQAFLANAFSLSASLTGEAPPQPVQATTLVGGTPSTPIIQKFEAGHFLTQNSGGIALEPEIALDQLNRYINHLHELRRINEGDDTADSPGYSLNLVRIPVSVLPGRATDHGYGAEITITATPYLNEGLLPVTFRSLVINDIVDQLALPITKIADVQLWEKIEKARADQALGKAKLQGEIDKLNVHRAQIAARLAELSKAYVDLRKSIEPEYEKIRGSSPDLPRPLMPPPSTAAATAANASGQDESIPYQRQRLEFQDFITKAPPKAMDIKDWDKLKDTGKEYDQRLAEISALEEESDSISRELEKRQAELILTDQAIGSIAPVGPSSRTRNAQNPIPPSQVTAVFGGEELLAIAKTFYDGYSGRDVRWNDEPNKLVHLPDVQRFLQSEIAAAYDLLSRPENLGLWEVLQSGTAGLRPECGFIHEIRHADSELLRVRRDNLIQELRRNCHRGNASKDKANCIEALVWAVLVESALLDAHLKGDMKSIAQLRGCGCLESDHLQFYLPDPQPQERQAFQEYVRCRWPIHVFALDPVTQDQNIGDAASIRRELQLAMSLAFVGGQMSANNFTKFTRQFEAQYETIALNRTVVGFSHGDDTFGWRFFPRFQTPPTKGNIAAFHETLFGKHKDCDLLDRKIESGMRECVAVVIMPSFVPYVTFDVRSNWFRLNHHHGVLPTRDQAEPSMTDTMKLSRAVQQMHNTASCIRDANCYRGGDVQLLMQRVHQLDRELPLQTMVAQVPIENTLGGLEMFSNGVTDLAPDLYGWYGGPGVLAEPPAATCSTTTPATINGLGGTPVQALSNVCPCVGGTTLFLVGDHFSVHDTKVIAGDQCINEVTLLSRQIMRVTLPGGLQPNKLDGVEYIDVHVATPYGVTSHLHIPYIRKEKPAGAPPAGWQWLGTTEFGACVCFKGCVDTTICNENLDLTKMFALFSRGDRVLLPTGEVTGDVIAVTPTLKAADGSVIASFDPVKLSTPLKVKFNQFQQGVFDGASDAELLQIVRTALKDRPNVAAVELATTIQIGGEKFSAGNVWTILIKTAESCATCQPASAAPSPKNRAGFDAPGQPTTPAGALFSVQGPELTETALAESLPQPSAVPETAPTTPTTSPQPTPAPPVTTIVVSPTIGGASVVANPQATSNTTTVMQGVPVFGQPVPVPVLVPALPSQPVQQAPALQRHPCPCKSLRFAVPGEAPVEGVPGEELGSIPMQSLRRMLGWSEPVLHEAPGFLDPELMPAGYLRPLPATN